MEFGVSGDCGEGTFEGDILEAYIWSIRTDEVDDKKDDVMMT